MKIIGYSERGAMNALFYQIAFYKEEGNLHMREFFRLAGFDNPEEFSDFEIYNEFSLSQFGNPDLVIIAKRGNEKVAFFIEAKVAACKGFKISSSKKEFEKDLRNTSNRKRNTSNLFYQLKQKAVFFKKRYTFPNQREKVDTGKKQKSIGNNPIVRAFVDLLKECSEAKFIAILPDVSAEGDPSKLIQSMNLPFKIHFIYWEDIYQKFSKELGFETLKNTIEFNQRIDPQIKSENRIKSQILNNPLKK